MITLVLGGARSGKSLFAQKIAGEGGLPVLYIATATAVDDEMAARIVHHQNNRPSEWRVQECPLELIAAIKKEGMNNHTILVDCLTLWLNNQLHYFPEQNYSELFDALVSAAIKSCASIIFVANEVGLGVIPLGQVSRQFVDEAGRLNQKIAQAANNVFFIAAGLPLVLKRENQCD